MRILIVSSLSPFKSANYGLDIRNALVRAGHEVDFLTKNRFDGMENNMFSVFDTPEHIHRRSNGIFHRIKMDIRTYFRYMVVRKTTVDQKITHKREDIPDVNPLLLTEKLNGHYDIAMTLFWDGMMTAKTLSVLHEKFGCPVMMMAVDMFPMTGGCYYFGNCLNYKNECQDCPASSKFKQNGQAHENFLIKKKSYENSDCYYLSNKWVCNSVAASQIIGTNRIKNIGLSINEEFFKPINKFVARRALGINTSGFVMFAGATDILIPRKGFFQLIDAVNKSAELIGKNNLAIVLAGNNSKNIKRYFDIDVFEFSFLSSNDLALMYAASDVLLSPSLDDAGPSMVNQSLMCGTPVVSFDIGVAQELLTNGVTGYKAKLGSVDDFANGISCIYREMKKDEMNIRQACRQLALKEFSITAFGARFNEICKEIGIDMKS